LIEEIVIELIGEKRKQAGSRLGIKKVYHMIKPDLKILGVKLGRDGLYELAHRNYLIIKPKKRGGARTTDSSQWRRQFADLAQDLTPQRPEQLFVSDITYLRILNGFVYLSLITDAYSRRIMGWHVHGDLSTTGCLAALVKAMQRRQYPHLPAIHHSDRGSQYCSSSYVSALRDNSIAISMTQSGSPYDNALAESVNGQLKVEYDLDATFANLEKARQVVDRVIPKYNNYRPHGSIDLRCPEEYHFSFFNLTGDVNV
jgi:transposase InsO family protein